jgi:hypothetical protein
MYLYVLLFVEGKISDKKMHSESNNATYKKRKFRTLRVLAFFELFPAVAYT